ncbi:MAG: PEP-CTERM system TPR-repeat protein PrsT [Desulfuromonadaceae bacterium]|nr:PEP-CTERM system TPR-repeat protein PrsT [Desulfuromonadaceae bacterium]
MKFLTQIVCLLALLMLVVGCQTQTKEDLLQQGKNAMQHDNPLGAAVYFKNVLEQDPNHVEARHQLGMAYIEAQKFDQAEKELSKVHLQNPSNGDVVLELVYVHLMLGQVAAAEDMLEQFLSGHPKNSRSQEYLGLILLNQGEIKQAVPLFDEAVELDPDNIGALLMKIRLGLMQNRKEDADALLKASLIRFPKEKQLYQLYAALKAGSGELDVAYATYQKIINLDPTDVQARYWAGVLALELNKTDEAQQFADYLLKRHPDQPSGTRLRGMILYAKEDYAGAALALRESLTKMRDLTGHYLLGMSEFRLKNYELALNQFQQVLDLLPEHVQSRIMLGIVLLQQGRIDDCIYQISQVLLKHDNIAIAHNVIGTAYLQKSDFDLASSHFDRAIALDPSLADAHVKKGLLNLTRQNPEMAELELVKALAVAPESLDTRFLLASLYLKQHNYQGVIDLLAKGVRATEQDALIYNYMAVAYIAQNKIEQGLDKFKQAKKIKADYQSPYLNLANYYLGQRQYEQALNEYLAILEFAPENVKVLIAIATLEELRGNNEAAKKRYQDARKTESPEGYLALAGYYRRAALPQKSAGVIEEAYSAHHDNAPILRLYGRLMLERKDYSAAIKAFTALEKINPEEGAPALMESLLANGEKKKAQSLARTKIATQPDNSLGYILLAALQQLESKADLAEETLQQGIERVAEPTFLIMQLGALYVNTGRIAEAEKKFSELSRAYPDFAPGIFALGMLSDQRGNKKKAEKLYREVLDIAENHTGAMNNLAYIYAENNSALQEALELSMRAFRNEPSNPSVLDTLGLVLLKNGRFTEAISVLEKATNLTPDTAILHIHLAQALIGAEKMDEAKRILQQVIEAGTNKDSSSISTSEVNQARQLLDKLNRQLLEHVNN